MNHTALPTPFRALPAALIPHPAFFTTVPMFTAREIALSALCAGLKARVVDQSIKITALEERNRRLMKALHRSAASGGALPEVCAILTLLVAAGLVAGLGGSRMLGGYALGFILATAWMCLLLYRHTPARTTPRRRVFPAEIHEPQNDARLIDAIRRAPAGSGLVYGPEKWPLPRFGEAYADESEFEPFERAIHHPEAQAARARFEATAAALR